MNMLEDSISQKNWGPITATLYVTENGTITVKGIFFDENNTTYPGPHYEIGKIPENLLAIKKDQPHCYIHTTKWRNYIRSLWKQVQDNPWFRYPG